MRKALWLALLWSLSVLAAGDAIDEVRTWLEKMVSAQQYLNYEGTFVYISGSEVRTLQIVHSFDSHGERERLTALDGDGREIVRDDTHFFTVLPVKKLVLVERRAVTPEGKADPPLESGLDYYDFSVNGSERIADHRCRIVAIYPRDAFRYGYRLCLEEDTGLLLKAQTLDRAGQPREQMMFTELKLPERIPTERLQTTVHETDFAVLESPAVAGEDSPFQPDPSWKLSELPPGFTVRRNEMRQIASSEVPVQHILLEDGLASVSIFIARPVPGEPYRSGLTTSGALSALSFPRDGYIVTLVGEVPPATLEFIARALVREPPAS